MTQANIALEASVSKKQLWASRVMSALPVIFLLFDASLKLFQTQVAIEGTVNLGYSADVLLPLGIIQLICVILYIIPNTSILGAVLLTGYLGGAVATHVRIDDPIFSHTLFPIYFGILLWGGIWLRNIELRRLFPLMKRTKDN